jgi:hypothetical protein
MKKLDWHIKRRSKPRYRKVLLCGKCPAIKVVKE